MTGRRRLNRFASFDLVCVGVALLSATAGCGRGDSEMIPIRGEVLFEGKPLAEGQVVYLPKTPQSGRQASGPVKPDGTFEMTTQKAKDGVAFGEYDIVVFGYGTDPSSDAPSREAFEGQRNRKRPSSIPERYSARETSGLSDSVTSEHEGFKRIELTK
jgi:hypothetical protein